MHALKELLRIELRLFQCGAVLSKKVGFSITISGGKVAKTITTSLHAESLRHKIARTIVPHRTLIPKAQSEKTLLLVYSYLDLTMFDYPAVVDFLIALKVSINSFSGNILNFKLLLKLAIQLKVAAVV